MTRVDFYVLAAEDAQARDRFACRLVEKAYKQGHRVYIQTRDPRHSRALDDLLWSFRAGSFVPHTLAHADTEAPVQIGEQAEQGKSEILVNLADTLPTTHQHYGRIAEIIDSSPQVRQQARQRYRQYRDLGYAVHSHNIDTNR